ncbi:Uncharacterized protein YnzC, UPF0291/DUF896 family [Anaerobranca californiensis DSM 14826]|uniref:UPF0291 protein SAMN02745227_00307 n=1 Tax=Anaerobranca californiensis DSM 14826 TaxID=1120989 RepID=A0A1M6KZ11_9FIRM|nr:DUF896 domain-containing protein [Anaerobranca californiensis]SHJ64243.1 Uncharacterized protein YnzC, UPF0291/DUF896 family [Anaerobranca californiensis DSM 14826]
MLSKEKIERINFLAKKQREHGLTAKEKEEQHQLRQEYVKAVKNQVKIALDNTKFVDEKGNEIKVNHKYRHNSCSCGCAHKH